MVYRIKNIEENLHISITKFEYLVATIKQINHDEILNQQWNQIKILANKIPALIKNLKDKLDQSPQISIINNLKYRFDTLLLKFTQEFKRINDMYVEIEMTIYKQLYCDICYFLDNIKDEEYLKFLNKIKNEIHMLCGNSDTIYTTSIEFGDCD